MFGQDFAYASRQALINSIRTPMSNREIAVAEGERAARRADIKRHRAVQYVKSLKAAGVDHA